MSFKKPAVWVVVFSLVAAVVIGAVLLSNPNTPALEIIPEASPNASAGATAEIRPSAQAALPSAKIAASSSPTTVPSPSASMLPLANPIVTLTESGMLLYTNKYYGFTLEFPANWKNKFLVYGGTAFYSKRVRDSDPTYGGRFFSIQILEGELFTKESIGNSFAKATLLAQGNGYSYIATFPTDVQYPDQDEAISEEFRAMQKYVKEICQSIKLSKIEPPLASNTGYKVIGGDFFSCEIPGEWEAKYDEQSLLVWKLYSGKDVVGSIEMIPYKSERPASDDKVIREYVLSGKNYGDAKISLSKEKTDLSVMEKIKGSMKLGHSFGALHYLSQANRYIEQGGEKIFGMVQSVVYKSISIRLMRYVEDASEKGYHIEDLKQTLTYPAQGMLGFIMLAAPDYKNYEPFRDPLYPPNSKIEGLSSRYFDFIIYKGNVMLAFERYLS